MGVTVRAPTRRPATHSCSHAEIAWIAAVPCALVLVAAIVVLGPPLGRVLFAPQGMAFWEHWEHAVLPEPTEHARYAISLLGPLMVSGVVWLAARRRLAWQAGRLALLAGAAQLVLVALAAVALWVQHRTAFTTADIPGAAETRGYFTLTTLVVAVAFALLLAFALTRPALVARTRALLRDTPARRAGAIAAAVLLMALWLLMAFNSDDTVGAGNRAVAVNVGNWIDEAFSVLDGQPPLVHLRAQYSQLWPYVGAGAMAVFGASLSVFAGAMLAGTAAAMLAVLALLRRLTRSWLGALILFAPFISTSFFLERGPLDDRYTPAHLFSLFPMRYGGPYLLAWLTVRHLDGARPHHRAPLFGVAGLVAINNVEFGLPALGATLAAVLWTSRPLGWRTVARLARDLALGLIGALVAVAALTLAVAGSLPDLSLALTFSRMFGVEGFGLLPMATVGMHLVLYATFAAALVVATVRATRGGDDAPLTGMLAWVGVFGLGAGSYFIGRSHPEVMISLFSAWALALVVLFVAAIGAVTALPHRRPAIAQLALFAGVGLALCSIAQTPPPGPQLARLQQTTPQPVFLPSAQEAAIAEQTEPGESVAIMSPVGHRVAYDIGIVNVNPYADPTMPAQQQLKHMVDALRATDGRKVFVALWLPYEEQLAALAAAGFQQTQVVPELELATLVDTVPR